MNTNYLTNILPDDVLLITYIKNGIICSKYFMLYSESKLSVAALVLYDLFGEELEIIVDDQILNIIYDSLSNNSFFIKKFINLREQVKSFNTAAKQLRCNLPAVLTKLTDHPTLTFKNKISLKLFASFVQIKLLLFPNSFNLMDVVTKSSSGPLGQFVLSCLFEAPNLTISTYKQYYKMLVEAYLNKDLSELHAEWQSIIKPFPKLTNYELEEGIKQLHKAADNSISKIYKIKEHQIKQNWSKLIKISYNCWPKMLSPNPFTEMIGL